MKFLKPPHEKVSSTKHSDYKNQVINTDKIVSVSKGIEQYELSIEVLPVIRFNLGERQQLWFFNKGDEAFRDKVFSEITDDRTKEQKQLERVENQLLMIREMLFTLLSPHDRGHYIEEVKAELRKLQQQDSES